MQSFHAPDVCYDCVNQIMMMHGEIWFVLETIARIYYECDITRIF